EPQSAAIRKQVASIQPHLDRARWLLARPVRRWVVVRRQAPNRRRRWARTPKRAAWRVRRLERVLTPRAWPARHWAWTRPRPASFRLPSGQPRGQTETLASALAITRMHMVSEASRLVLARPERVRVRLRKACMRRLPDRTALRQAISPVRPVTEASRKAATPGPKAIRR